MFNLRDVTKVFQGLCECKSNSITSKKIFVSLINHELDRVFKDRLIDVSDVTEYRRIVDEKLTEHLGGCDETH